MKNIYLDMDGVIADFDKRYEELIKITTKESERDKKWVQFFDKFIQDRHFATLDLMPEAIELMDYLKVLVYQLPFLVPLLVIREMRQLGPRKWSG